MKLKFDEQVAVFVSVGVVVLLTLVTGLANPFAAASNNALTGGANLNNVTDNEQNTGERINRQGVEITTLREGTGAGAKAGNLVVVNYRGTLADGTVFDSSYDRGQPIPVLLGAGQVIPGWDIGLVGMKVGEERRLVIPANLAYGPQGITSPTGEVIIPANATLTFDVELLQIQDLSQATPQ
jgi:FKBP-type peptidyl-prolyl cis-trans isomerase